MMAIYSILFALWLGPNAGIQWHTSIRIGTAIWAACSIYDVDALEGVAVAWLESRFIKTAVSPSGACGIMQTMKGPKGKWQHPLIQRIPWLANTIEGQALDGCRHLGYWKKRYPNNYHCHYVDGNKCWSKEGKIRAAKVKSIITNFLKRIKSKKQWIT